MTEFNEASPLTEIMFKIEDLGWSPLGFAEAKNEIDLETVKEFSELLRALVSINPLVKRGVGVRTSYIWGKDFDITSKAKTKQKDVESIIEDLRNQKYLFSSEAQAENEKTLATDGVFLYFADRGKKSGERVPLTQITDSLSNPENSEEIWFYRRKWASRRITPDGIAKEFQFDEYYPTDYFIHYGGKIPKVINNIKVNQTRVVVDHTVNAQTGWRYGLPDAMAVTFWAKAHKDFLEDQAKLVKAYSKIAIKATAQTPEGVNAMAQQVQRAFEGDAGGAIAMAAGANFQTVGRTAGSVDFTAGTPMAGYVAAGLEVPLQDLLADAKQADRSGAEALDKSKLTTMQLRQKSWVFFFQRLFKMWGIDNINVHFPDIEEDPMFRKVQSLVAAKSLNVIHPEELRDMTVEALNLNTDKGLPTLEDLELLLTTQTKGEAENDIEMMNRKQSNPSYGDNTNRSEIGAHEYDKSDGNDYK